MLIFGVLTLVLYVTVVAGGDIDSEDYDKRTTTSNTQAIQNFLESGIWFDRIIERYGRSRITYDPRWHDVSCRYVRYLLKDETKTTIFELFRRHGTLQRESFWLSGYVTRDGPARVLAWKVFANKSTILEEIRQTEMKPLEAKVFSVLTHVLFTKEDIKKLKDCLVKDIAEGKGEDHQRNAPKIELRYACCIRIAEPGHSTAFPRYGAVQLLMN